VVAVELAFDPAIPLLTRAITTAMKPRPHTLLASPLHGSSELKDRKLAMWPSTSPIRRTARETFRV
jgi:hypothetical protein